ncbi:MAG TPA: glycosyltransferase family 2 protein [Bacteroidota bacterium]|nr:glycosyltransferase family 2 protein [Bacteroidota bacterium]
MTHLIDVTICTLNSEHSIEGCLRSVFQFIPVNNVIIVDGGSTDHTITIAKKFGDKIRLHSMPELNLGKSREYAFSLVETEWFLQVDSDVILNEKIVPAISTYMEKADVIEFGTVGHFSFPYPTPADLKKRSYQNRAFFIINLMRKKAVENISIDINTMEEELVRRLMKKKGYTWLKTDEILGDHYSKPVRYKGRNPVSLIRSNPMKSLEFYELGKMDRNTGVDAGRVINDLISTITLSLNISGFLTALKGVSNPFTAAYNYLKGYSLKKESTHVVKEYSSIIENNLGPKRETAIHRHNNNQI